ncbi:hypothetical protein HPP92_020772 [Vanilla planifolia]|uniref:protein-serine/threonine phosphatase n=1 Tax=Vanilla planifolia TaxID=51239 RepID=A0A835UK35_VANPL|nr:hypothetical protein HPP92_020772 [Vanilla planifolia]
MGNDTAKLSSCFSTCSADRRKLRGIATGTSEPHEEDVLGHSFFYARPDPYLPRSNSSKVHHSEEIITFHSISGAAVSANTETPLSAAFDNCIGVGGAAFDTSSRFAFAPLHSVQIADNSGVILDPIHSPSTSSVNCHSRVLCRSLSHYPSLLCCSAASILGSRTKLYSREIPAPMTELSSGNQNQSSAFAGQEKLISGLDAGEENVDWAHGRAGEDRVHVVISEKQGWLFVGIYDGFNGPDATDYLLSNLYTAVQQELKGLLWGKEKQNILERPSICSLPPATAARDIVSSLTVTLASLGENTRDGKRQSFRSVRNWQEKQREKKYEWVRERSELDYALKKQSNSSKRCGTENHNRVLKSLSHALKKTEKTFLKIADRIVAESPELALMGSCVLVMLMMGDDVYLMNVGDSRAVLAQKSELNLFGLVGKEEQDLERINEENVHDLNINYVDGGRGQGADLMNLVALQLTKDHSTCIEEELRRIKSKHPDDAAAILNNRVKGSLKVTRAFGAGFLKQPKWNDALLEMFRIDYIGTSPYITCCPFLYHHKLGPRDRFLILSSDGLYQYFTNEEAVAEIQSFMTTTPGGDPAQHIVQKILLRAANRAEGHIKEESPRIWRRSYRRL